MYNVRKIIRVCSREKYSYDFVISLNGIYPIKTLNHYVVSQSKYNNVSQLYIS